MKLFSLLLNSSFLVLMLLITSNPILAQCQGEKLVKFEELFCKAEDLLNAKQFKAVLHKFNAAKTYCPEKTKEVDEKIEALFEAIN